MLTLNIQNRQHYILEDHTLLVYSSWNKDLISLTFADHNPTVPMTLLEEYFPQVIKSDPLVDLKGNTFQPFLVSKKPFDLTNPLDVEENDSHTPWGLILGPNYKATVYRFIKWCFDYNNYHDISNDILKELTDLFITPNLSKPDVKQILLYPWKKTTRGKSETWSQSNKYACKGPIYTIEKPTGYVSTLDSSIIKQFTGILVTDKPPHIDVLTSKLVKPLLK